MDKKRILIVVEGIVQGVGFRPFVFNLAEILGLKGWVNNNSEGVYIDVEGFEKDINKFMQALKNDPPPLSRIEKITMKADKVLDYSNFKMCYRCNDEYSDPIKFIQNILDNKNDHINI